MAVAQYISAKFSIRAVIGDTELLDIIEFSSATEANAIPQGRLLVAVGREVKSLKPATIHSLVSKLTIKTPVKVYLKGIALDATPGLASEWPSQEFLLWDGWAVGTGWERSGESAAYSIALLHWLDDLNNSSAISGSSHPYNPGDFTYSAMSPTLGVLGAGGPSDPSWTAMSGPQNDVGASELEEDLWMRCLQPWMVEIAEQDTLDEARVGGGGKSRGGNKAALNALSRMTNKAGGGRYVPLAMDLTGANGNVVAEAIIDALHKESYFSWVNTTLWGKLIGEWAPSYFFAVVPRIQDALVVPFVGGLSQTYTTIAAQDYSVCQLSGTMPQVLHAVGIYCGTEMLAEANTNPGEYPISYSTMGGKFPADWNDGDPDGLLLIKDPPKWLATATRYADYSLDTTGAESDEPVANALAPDVGKDAPEAAGKPDANAAGLTSANGLLDRYAHQWFVAEMLKSRTGELSGKLRFDISPCSSIIVIGGADKHLGGSDQLAQPFYANVTRVTHVINAQNQRAGTAFALDHIRTAAENADPKEKTSINRPPLYQNAFTGAGLHDLFQPKV